MKKRIMNRILWSFTILGVGPGVALADAVIDGLNIPADLMGHSVALQGIQTGWADDTDPDQLLGAGSELDQLFINSDVSDGFLKMAFTGNMEPNLEGSLWPSNGFVVFLDSKPGGENVLDDNGEYSGGARFVVGLQGTRFDSGFWPDYGLVVNASSPDAPGEFYVDLVDLQSNTSRWLGLQDLGSHSGVLGLGDNPNGSQVAFDNSNKLGVGAGDGAPDADSGTATSGVELLLSTVDIELALDYELGVQVLLTSSASFPPFTSNQNLPSLPDYTPNFDQTIPDYTLLDGLQYAKIPEPATLSLVALGSLALLRRRRAAG